MLRTLLGKRRPAAVTPPIDLSRPSGSSFPSPLMGIGNLDRWEDQEVELTSKEARLMRQIDDSIGEGKFQLPQLSTSSQDLLSLASHNEPEVDDLVRFFSRDAALTAILLRVANSVRYGGARNIDTVHGAVVQIGLRGLRSILYSVCLRNLIFSSKRLQLYAEEVWRQSVSVGEIARCIAVPLCLDPERAYVLGLLHDVGKIPVLEILRKHAPSRFKFRAEFVGQALRQHHEKIGETLLENWDLPDEIVSVASNHHGEKPADPGPVALVLLAHRLDLDLSTGNGESYLALETDLRFDTLEMEPKHRLPLLSAIQSVYVKNRMRELLA